MDGLIVQTLWIVVQSMTSIASIHIAEVVGFRCLNWIAFLMYASTYFLLAEITNFYIFVILYSFLAGFSIGLGYMLGFYIAWSYFPESKSIVSGIIFFMAGGSASILSPLTTRIVNPDNLSFKDPLVYNNVPTMFRYLGVYFFVLTMIAGVLQPAPVMIEKLEKKEEESNLEEENGS